MIQWLHGEENLEFKLRKVKIDEGVYEHVQDMFINNIIYRPVELEHLACYDMISRYELKGMTQEKIKSDKTLVENKNHLI